MRWLFESSDGWSGRKRSLCLPSSRSLCTLEAAVTACKRRGDSETRQSVLVRFAAPPPAATVPLSPSCLVPFAFCMPVIWPLICQDDAADNIFLPLSPSAIPPPPTYHQSRVQVRVPRAKKKHQTLNNWFLMRLQIFNHYQPESAVHSRIFVMNAVINVSMISSL